MERNAVVPGLKVKTFAQLGKLSWMLLIDREHWANQGISRLPNMNGIVGSYVPNYETDAWLVAHDNGTVGIYGYFEFDSLPNG